MNSIDKRFSRNVFEAVQKPRITCFIGSKTTRRLVVLKLDKTAARVLNITKKLTKMHRKVIKTSNLAYTMLLVQGRTLQKK